MEMYPRESFLPIHKGPQDFSKKVVVIATKIP